MMIILTLTVLMASCASKNTTTSETQQANASAAKSDKENSAAKSQTPATAKKTKKGTVKAETVSDVSQTGAGVSSAEVSCSAANDIRKLAITTKNTGCELNYTKGSETKVIASQIIGDKKCQEVMNSVKEKLVAAKFECK